MTHFFPLQSMPLGCLAVFLLVTATPLMGEDLVPAPSSGPARVVQEADAILEQIGHGAIDESLLEQQQRFLNSLTELLAGRDQAPTGDHNSPETTQPAPQKPPTGNDATATPSTVIGPASQLSPLQHPKSIQPLADAIWGHLPDRERQELYQSYSEQYLPRYDSELRSYFRALAELQDQPVSTTREAKPASAAELPMTSDLD